MQTPTKNRGTGNVILDHPFALATVLVILDQATKVAVKGFNILGVEHHGMQLYESKEVLGDFLRLTYVENPGMAFGLNFGMPVILSLFSIAASIFLVYLIKRTTQNGNAGLRLAFAMILGGAVGNLIDRVFYGLFYGYAPLFYGKVVDFVDVNIPDMNILGNELNRFYVFNIADAAVSIGVVLLLIFYPSKKEAPAEEHVVESTQPATPGEAPSHQEMTVS